MKIKYSNLGFTPKEINEDQHTIRAVFSTGDVDRHGEIVDQKSWILDDFLKNPVVLFGHDHGQPPVGMITGLGYNADGDLEGEVKFAAKEYPFANVIWNLYKGGYMKAFSVGFAAGKVDIIDEQVVLKDNVLYEVSTVSVPANAMALAKAKGMNVDALETKLAADLAKALNMKLKEEKTEETETTEDAPVEEKCEACGDVVEDKSKGCPCKNPPTKEEAAPESDDEAPEEKGAVADAVSAEEEREKKWAALSPVFDVFNAFLDTYLAEDASSDDFATLLAETASLMMAVAKDPMAQPTKDLLDKAREAIKSTLLEKLVAREEGSEKGFEKTVQEFIETVKEGKVLSKANRSKVQNAVDALQTLLDADSKDDKAISANNTEFSIRVETPAVRIAVPAKGANKAKLINKAVRALLAEKRAH